MGKRRRYRKFQNKFGRKYALKYSLEDNTTVSEEITAQQETPTLAAIVETPTTPEPVVEVTLRAEESTIEKPPAQAKSTRKKTTAKKTATTRKTTRKKTTRAKTTT